jgi:hypothetical protein
LQLPEEGKSLAKGLFDEYAVDYKQKPDREVTIR